MSSSPDLKAAPSHGRLKFLLAVIIGFLGANPFADAVGFQPYYLFASHTDDYVWAICFRVVCGLLVGLLALSLFSFFHQQVVSFKNWLSTLRDPPPMPVVLTLIICGTICLAATLWFEWRLTMSPGVSVGSEASMMGKQLGAQVSLGFRSSFAGQLAAIATFGVGLTLLGLGVWSSFQMPQRNVPPLPEITPTVG